MKNQYLVILIILQGVIAQQAMAVNFEAEKEFLLKNFNCSKEQNIQGSATNSSVWLCLDADGFNRIQISRRETSKDQVDTIRVLMFSNSNQKLDQTMVALGKAIASKYSTQYSSDIVNLIKGCQANENFDTSISIEVGCVKGPVKTERHLTITLHPKAP